jgi:hypothetical protein
MGNCYVWGEEWGKGGDSIKTLPLNNATAVGLREIFLLCGGDNF